MQHCHGLCANLFLKTCQQFAHGMRVIRHQNLHKLLVAATTSTTTTGTTTAFGLLLLLVLLLSQLLTLFPEKQGIDKAQQPHARVDSIGFLLPLSWFWFILDRCVSVSLNRGRCQNIIHDQQGNLGDVFVQLELVRILAGDSSSLGIHL